VSRLDVLLVTPASRSAVYQSLGSEIAAIEPPVWSGLIATYMRNNGFSVDMLDAEAQELTHDQTATEIAKRDPLLTVFVVYGQQPSASTQCMPAGRAVCKAYNEKSPGAFTIVMGTHSSSLPRLTLENEPYMFVCQGEGPVTILGLTKTLKDGSHQFENVPGLWYRSGSEIKSNKMADKIKDLDKELPGQAWDLLDMTKYRAHNWHAFDHIDQRKPYASIQTSLGCPFKCSFCCINAPFGGSGIRYWSPDNIIAQIDTLVTKYGAKNIKIPDELFVLHEQHVMGICDHIIERGYDLNIWAYARVDTVKEKFVEKLKRAGVNWLALGIESGSKHVRDGVEKGRFGDTDIELVVKKIRDAGIYVLGNYIFGLPDDTYDSMKETLDLSKRLNTEWANFYSAMAYPGSQLYGMAVKGNWKLPEDWIGYSQHAFETLPLPTETLSGPEVLAFRDLAHIDYFSSESYLSLVNKTFGSKVVAAVHKMLEYDVKRKFVTPEIKARAAQHLAGPLKKASLPLRTS
jgi:anaerobic magnesium-protoporphyrin IX monomethyl ester cyclase